MKNVLILHGNDNKPTDSWYKWVAKELENIGYKSWVPQLPNNHVPNTQDNLKFIHANKDFIFNEETIIIGHSSGSVLALLLAQELPGKVKIDTIYAIASFKEDLKIEGVHHEELFLIPFDFDKIKKKTNDIVFIHSNDDPYCPLEGAEWLTEQADGELLILPGQKHFSTFTAGDAYKKFPKLLDIITATI